MQTLKSFNFSWPALNRALAEIVATINRNSPLEGSGITLTEHGEQGVSINAAAKKADQQNQGGGSQGIVGPCNLRLYDVSFMPATIVDPTTCQQTFVQVLIQDPGGWTDFDADIEQPGNEHPAQNPSGG